MSLSTTPKAESFYKESIAILKETGIPFMVGGTFALNAYTGIDRKTKDVDFFCKASDYPKILNHFTSLGYKTVIEDERWIAKVKKGRYFFDIIFNSSNALNPVTDEWIKESAQADVLGFKVNIIPPTEFIWSKAFIQNRSRYDGADIVHVMLKKNKDIHWDRLLTYFDQYWEVLLVHVLNFRFVYPSERELVPRKIIDELVNRLQEQTHLPSSQKKVCRGRLFSLQDYQVDVEEWGFADLIGEAHEPRTK